MSKKLSLVIIDILLVCHYIRSNCLGNCSFLTQAFWLEMDAQVPRMVWVFCLFLSLNWCLAALNTILRYFPIHVLNQGISGENGSMSCRCSMLKIRVYERSLYYLPSLQAQTSTSFSEGCNSLLWTHWKNRLTVGSLKRMKPSKFPFNYKQ